ncbi:hypothetical protein Nepgr_006118 [Nepenthes gracilis]|uniref:DNA/RNA-binding protein Kin17 WH-like domain-containing protein n=1 Tax=Nepenthes gracilis TaxID=150966 RepID=A0AAD3S4G1_NEPGR|nr:hypothetical protein Nepgr_006118 [Nepenthes gracilis]
MCQKQCRGKNGFKCHCMSEGHQRRMQIFSQNPDCTLDGYSEEFEDAFLKHMKCSHRFRPVAATVVYDVYIWDRHHSYIYAFQPDELLRVLGADREVQDEKDKRVKTLLSAKQDNGSKITFALGSSGNGVPNGRSCRVAIKDVEGDQIKKEKAVETR